MLLRPVVRSTKPFQVPRCSVFTRLRQLPRSNFSTSRTVRAIEPDGKAIRVKSTTEEATDKSRQRLKRILDKLPASMRPHAERLMSAPGSYVFTFLLLHEVTAVVPLFGLIWLFQVTDWIPPVPEGLVEAGKEFYSKTFPSNSLPEGSESAARLILQGATAYAIVKMSLPLRVAFSLLITPWFARRSVIPLVNRLQKLTSMITKPKEAGINFNRPPSGKSK
ncbi:hypothetical protein V1509DRAFT_567808 [Lipomyces kononenkoae]